MLPLAYLGKLHSEGDMADVAKGLRSEEIGGLESGLTSNLQQYFGVYVVRGAAIDLASRRPWSLVIQAMLGHKYGHTLTH